MQFLYIEDDEFDRLAVYRYLGKWDLQNCVIFKNTLSEAIDQLKENKYQVIFSDLQLTDGNALSLLTKFPKQKFIFISGIEDREVLEIIHANKNAQFIKKDFDLSYLLLIKNEILKAKGKEDISKISKPTNPNIKTDYDLSNLRRSFNNNEKLVMEVVKEFIKHIPIKLKALDNAIGQKNETGIKNITHQLKTSFSLMGLKKCYSILVAMEDQASQTKKNEAFDFPKQFKNLSTLTSNGIVQLENLLEAND